jgi:CubicO group peptidase (beta-lactamase class C family)
VTEIEGEIAPGFEAVREAFAANFAEGAEIGAAVSVYRHGERVVDLWGGVADPQEGRPWQRDTLQAVFSTTKAMTAACALLLVQRGELDLDAPVQRYWPEFTAPCRVRWLLTHQAGLPIVDQTVPLADALAWDPVVKLLAVQEPFWTPGTEHGYHGLTFGWLVGEVVRRVSGRSLGTFFRTEIAEPLGLDFWIGLPKSEHHRLSRIVPPELPDPDEAAGFDIDALPEEMRDVFAVYSDPTSLSARVMSMVVPPMDNNDPDVLSAEIPAGNGVGTARAVAGFYAALIGGFLEPDTLALATTEQAAGKDRIMRVPVRWSHGFSLSVPETPWLPPSGFGMGGMGGSIGIAVPASGLAFGYVMNRMGNPMGPDPRTVRLITAAVESVEEQR